MVKRKKTRDEVSIPDYCPVMKDCKERLFYVTWENFCNTGSWIQCENPVAKKRSRKYKQRACTWKLIEKLE